MKPKTKQIIENLRRVCLSADMHVFHDLITESLSSMELSSGWAEESDELESIVGFKWKVLDNGGNLLRIVDEFPQNTNRDNEYIDNVVPTPSELRTKFETISPHQVAAVLGAPVSQLLDVSELYPNLMNLHEWSSEILPALEAALHGGEDEGGRDGGDELLRQAEDDMGIPRGTLDFCMGGGD